MCALFLFGCLALRFWQRDLSLLAPRGATHLRIDKFFSFLFGLHTTTPRTDTDLRVVEALFADSHSQCPCGDGDYCSENKNEQCDEGELNGYAVGEFFFVLFGFGSILIFYKMNVSN